MYKEEHYMTSSSTGNVLFIIVFKRYYVFAVNVYGCGYFLIFVMQFAGVVAQQMGGESCVQSVCSLSFFV